MHALVGHVHGVSQSRRNRVHSSCPATEDLFTAVAVMSEGEQKKKQNSTSKKQNRKMPPTKKLKTKASDLGWWWWEGREEGKKEQLKKRGNKFYCLPTSCNVITARMCGRRNSELVAGEGGGEGETKGTTGG